MARYLFFVSKLYSLAVLRPLQQSIRARGGEAAWFFEHEKDATYLRTDERRLQTVRDVTDWRPEAVFVPGNWVPHYFPGLKVEVFHGFSVGKRSESRGHFRIRGSFDLYCTQGPDTTGPFRELARHHGHFRVVETGWPKVDPLFSGPYATIRDAANRAVRPVVMYASTFTESISSARALRDTIARIAASGPWQWLVTLHPMMAREVIASYQALQGPNLRFVMNDDILSLYTQADVLLSDTSLVVPEFLLMRKPVVTFRNRKPGPQLLNVEQLDQVQPALEHALTRPAALMQAIEHYSQQIHPYRDGRSSERVLDATQHALELGPEGLRAKPFNLVRRLQARHRLGHWRM